MEETKLSSLKKHIEQGIKERDTFHNLDEALFHFKASLSKALPESYYHYGICLLEMDDFEGLKALKTSHSLGYLPATKTLAEYYSMHSQTAQSAPYYYTLYTHDSLTYNKALFQSYQEDTFKTKDEELAFLKRSADHGLYQAKLFLALFYLNNPSYKKVTMGECMLVEYFNKTDDVKAATELFYLYSKNYPRYTHYKAKDNHKAAHYFSEVMRLDGTLDGAEIFDFHPFYLPEDVLSVHDFTEQVIFRLKTSLSVDLAFEASFDKEQLNMRLVCQLEPVIQYEGHITYELDEVTESALGNKHTVLVEHKAPFESPDSLELIESTMVPIDSLKALISTLETKDVPIDFDALKPESAMKAHIEKEASHIKLPEKAKNKRYSYNYHYLYVIKPTIVVDYTYKNKRYKSVHDLTDFNTVDKLDYPLEPSVKKAMNHTLSKIKSTQDNTKALLLFTSIMQSFILFHLYDALNAPFIMLFFLLFVLVPLSLNGFLYYKMAFTKISEDEYLTYYDRAEIEALLKTTRLNKINLSLTCAYALLTGLALMLLF